MFTYLDNVTFGIQLTKCFQPITINCK